MEAWEAQVPFRTFVEAEEKITSILSKEEIDDCFDYNYHIKHVDMIFERLGLKLDKEYFIKESISLFKTIRRNSWKKVELLYEGKAKQLYRNRR